MVMIMMTSHVKPHPVHVLLFIAYFPNLAALRPFAAPRRTAPHHTAQIEPFHRVFRRPLSALRADPIPFVAATVLSRASDGRRQSVAPKPASIKSSGGGEAKLTVPSGGGGRGGGGGGAGGTWAKRGLSFAGSGGLGIALGAGGGGGMGSGGVKKGVAKFKKGLRKASQFGTRSKGVVKGDGAAVVMSGAGVDGDGPQTVRALRGA